MVTPDSDGVHRCRMHSIDVDLVAERRERRKRAQRAHRIRKAQGKAKTGQVTADELAALDDAPPSEGAGKHPPPPDVAAWVYGQDLSVPAEDWPAITTHVELIEVRRRVVVAIARGWISDSEAKVMHQHLTGIKQSLGPPSQSSDDQRGARIVFETVRSREDAARIKLAHELEAEA